MEKCRILGRFLVYENARGGLEYYAEGALSKDCEIITASMSKLKNAIKNASRESGFNQMDKKIINERSRNLIDPCDENMCLCLI